MFKTDYINEIMQGKLSEDGYKHFLSVVGYFIRKYHWSKSLIISDVKQSTNYWTDDDISELTHQYFEWIIIKNKLQYLNKIPRSYLSYYFSQILVTFVANKIKEQQQKEGLSFEKVKELVLAILEENYHKEYLKNSEYWFNKSFTLDKIKSANDIEISIKYLSKIPIVENTRHYKPLVKMAIDDVFTLIDSPLKSNELIKIVFSLFDQKFFLHDIEKEIEEEAVGENNLNNYKYIQVVKVLLEKLSYEDVKLINEYLFQHGDQISISDLAKKYKIPKSTVHSKIENFRKKIVFNFTPENEEDGIAFLKNLSGALDELANSEYE